MGQSVMRADDLWLPDVQPGTQDSIQNPDATILDLLDTIHFQTLEGTDYTVGPGAYRLQSAHPEGLRLQHLDGSASTTVKADTLRHDFQLRGPLAIAAPEGQDVRHIALLLPDGQGLDAVGSLSGIGTRATAQPTLTSMTMQQAIQVLPAASRMQLIAAPPDPCAGAIPPAPVMTAAVRLKPLASNLATKQLAGQPVAAQEFGPDPIPDVLDWQPKQKIPAGRQLIIQGRNLDPARFVAKIGDLVLPAAAQSSTEIRLAIPAEVRSFGTPLMVYHRGGTPRTLEPTYEVFDPVAKITRVVPETFSQGDLVTLCGVSMSHLSLNEPVKTGLVGGVPQYETRKLTLIGTHNGQYQNYHYFEMVNPISSPAGDRLTLWSAQASIKKFSERPLRAGRRRIPTSSLIPRHRTP